MFQPLSSIVERTGEEQSTKQTSSFRLGNKNQTSLPVDSMDSNPLYKLSSESSDTLNNDMSQLNNHVLEVMPDMLHNNKFSIDTVNNSSCENIETNNLHLTNIVPSDLERENVPTLGIIVLPMSLNMCGDQSDESCDGSFDVVSDEPVDYQVLFSDSSSAYPVELLTGSETSMSQEDCDKERGITLLSADQDVAVFSAPVDMQFL